MKPGQTPFVAKSEREGAERMREMLRTGRWPSGAYVNDSERRVIEHNIALVERKYGK